jgi:hypothetical protein
VGEISRPPANSFLDKQTVSKTLDGSVTSLSGKVTNDDDSKTNTMPMSVFAANNGEEFSMVRMKLNGTAVLQATVPQLYICVAQRGKIRFSSPKRPDPTYGATNLLPVGKRPGREADHSPPSNGRGYK